MALSELTVMLDGRTNKVNCSCCFAAKNTALFYFLKIRALVHLITAWCVFLNVLRNLYIMCPYFKS